MARMVHQLNDLKVRRFTAPGLYADGAGLYLQISRGQAKSWLYRFTLHGRTREMGLGSAAVVGLAEARALADAARRKCKTGIDPIEARNAERAKAELEVAQAISFKECAARYIDTHRAGWRNSKHAAQWESTLATYAEPELGRLPVQAIDTGLVLKALEPIWSKKPETASRVRGRIEAVLDWARARGYRAGENPARWRGHMDQLLPRRSKVKKVEHHAALPYTEIPKFMSELRALDNTAARALEFLILTAGRTTEILGAQFDELGDSCKVWSVPADRMKAGKEHRVPLSSRAREIVAGIKRGNENEYIFSGAKRGKQLSNMTLLKLLGRMGRGDLTVHGFRSTFRDWAAERSNFPREVVEMALAHAIESKVEAAYRRGDLFEKRRRLMEEWAKYCSTIIHTGNIVAINHGAR